MDDKFTKLRCREGGSRKLSLPKTVFPQFRTTPKEYILPNRTNSQSNLALSGASREHGGALRAVLVLLVSLSLAGVGVAYTFGYVVPPGTMGVRQNLYPPRKGFEREALPPGYHWSIPVYSTIHFLPSTVQLMHFHRDRGAYTDAHDVLEIQTTDGSSVNVDLTVFYRFFTAPSNDYPSGEDSHGGPAELLQKVGTEETWRPYLTPAIVKSLKESLGRLSTSQFYNPELREREVAKALKSINKGLNANGIEVLEILLRRYTYEEKIDNAIFEKNLQDQEENLSLAAARLAKEKADLERIAAEKDAEIKTLRVTGKNAAEVKRAEADRYNTEKRAKGDLLVAKAQAEVDRARAGVLANATGSEVYVAKEMAPLLKSLKGGIVSDIDPYNLPSWMGRLGVTEEK